MGEFASEMNRLAGTVGLEAQGAAQVWADAPGMELLGCLNKKNGTAGVGLLGVLNSLAGTTGLGLNAAASAITAGPAQSVVRVARVEAAVPA